MAVLVQARYTSGSLFPNRSSMTVVISIIQSCLTTVTMSTPDNLFDAYHSDYQHLIGSVRNKLEKDAQEQQGGMPLIDAPALCRLVELVNVEQRKATLRRVEIELDEADDIVSTNSS